MIWESLGLSLALTLAIEVPICLLRKISIKVAGLVNVLTNPAVVLLYFWAQYLGLPTVLVVLLLELSAVWVEGYFFRDYTKHPWLFSLMVNAISFSIGLAW